MENKKNWESVPVEFLDKWRGTFYNNKEGLNLSEPCPICGKKTLHQYYNIGKLIKETRSGINFIGHGGLWEWCSSCKHFEHYSALVPEWWACDLKVDEKELTVFPDAIEQAIKKRVT